MIKSIHDCTHKMFRDPVGPCRPGSPVSLTLLTAAADENTAEGAAAPLLHLRFDKDASQQTLEMQPASCPAPAGFLCWNIEFVPSDKGLWWYWFELTDGTLIGQDQTSGEAIPTSDPHAWQITVFDPSYEDIDWIRGGVFYHIFVDRFAKGSGEETLAGKTASGETASGETASGETASGETASGETASGETASGETASGETTSGETPVCGIPDECRIVRDDWGGEPIWRPDEHGEILNNDFFGGNLAGIREKLPYLADLGVTCLYLSPIFEAYSSHKYDTSDYMKVDPFFGDEQGFTRLCAEAAEYGMRIICDGVFSHTGSDSRYFDVHDRYGNGACHHPDSPYRDWYYFENESWQSWWGILTLPRINKESPSYQEFMAGENGVIRHWLRAGASGWRLDVVDELPSAFLEKITAAAKAERPDALMLGEVWEDASNKVAYEERKNYFEGDKLDSVMNYPLRRGIIDYVRQGDAQMLAEPMNMLMEHYPARNLHGLMNILGTHDTERILTALGGKLLGPDAGREEKAWIRMDETQWRTGLRRLKIAVVLQMTLPGVPCIYYGDEAGMEGYNDPFNRRCYPWGHENHDLQDWYRKVIAIRLSNDVYVDGRYHLLAARGGLFAFQRTHAESDPALTETNASIEGTGCQSGREGLVTVTNTGRDLEILPLLGDWRDLLSDEVFTDDILVLPGQAMILTAK